MNVRKSLFSKINRIKISLIAKFVHTNKEVDSRTLCSQTRFCFFCGLVNGNKKYIVNVHMYIEKIVLFWSSNCQEFIRVTAWGTILSLWRLVLADNALQRRPEGKSLNSL
ncbi:hypothetical protein ATANTOWER_025101 [Ataeniobius toweri]|uniref:Uncharacterized protein n=1 Tax=Ataeniobius toweri TaxID=208326 RepID=A0ABU7AVS6_9TELE|nr:hypothetical protein [Ataeniobius toweri]